MVRSIIIYLYPTRGYHKHDVHACFTIPVIIIISIFHFGGMFFVSYVMLKENFLLQNINTTYIVSRLQFLVKRAV